MIGIKKLTKIYDGQKVVDRLDLQVKKGSIFGFLGPNGAGKTTTVKMIVGISKPTSGSIRLEGQKVDKSLIGYMPEDPYFYDRLTAKEFLEFVCDLFPSSLRRGKGWWQKKKTTPKPLLEKEGKISEVLKLVGLKDASNKKIAEFSKGMKQRLGLAQAIINNPEYLFLDEPLDGLDPIGRLEFKKNLLQLRKEGKTIFFNSHILSDVEEICNEIGILDKGKLIYSGPVKKFCGKKTLEEKFVEVIGNC
jgi:ABC-2 type transport system ATP-binding protein